ncbi:MULTISPECIES: putative bifunctional diguanylate cyclase/phosphodiesterase [Robertmurraya]|uniref:Bifunctional diguanylate cyclase/phosphodiesterase n=1 Tax=Robertmurraya beringensis TaxID=641660 RepID=A0ABV6KPL3_9BACI|nr:diguanylate cyclase (GGDEF) domain-containing protein [Mycobacteroides abscessus subsp. abscessus]
MEQFKKVISREVINDKNRREIEGMIFDIILNHINDMVFIMKVDGDQFRYVFANKSGAKHARLTVETMGKTLFEVMPVETAKRLQAAYMEVVESKELQVLFDQSTLEDGKLVHGQSILTPVLNENKEVRFVVSVTRDITELEAEKSRLEVTEQRYRSIVDHNLDGVILATQAGDIIDANPASEILSGYTVDELKKKSIFDFVDEFDVDKFREFIEHSLSGISLETLDFRIVNSSKRKITVQLKTVPFTIHNKITGIYLIFRDLTEQSQNAETIKFMAFHDQLTGLYNRRALLRDLDLLLNHSESNKEEPFCLLSIDIDRFKQLNDSLGHFAGDQILIKIAERLSVDRTDEYKVYRQGGDEFIVLLKGNRQSANQLAQQILNRFAKSFYLDSHEYYISPSIGLSMYPQDGKDAETLIKNADEALFRVKEKGKAHYQFYRSDKTQSFANIVSLETQLRKALERDEFILLYQPQVELRSGKIKSFEALIRWNSIEFGLVPPSEFIPLSEDTGLIIPIGNWVIEQACMQIKEWNDLRGEEITIAINISAKQFQQRTLVSTIKKAIQKFQINPSLLEIEITEGVMQDTAETAPILKSLKDLGISIAIDDFGTGYSSLNYLKSFPIDVLKVDQSFIRGIHNNDKDAAITTTIIHLANSLGMTVVAEGIEEKAQAKFLLNTNCDKGQGYFYSKPLSKIDIEQTIFNRPTKS